MSLGKKLGISIFILFCIFCLGINGWWLYVSQFANDKVTSETFEVGLQTTTDGTTKYFMEVNSYDNCFELKFNYMLDEKQEAFFSQGLQYFNEDGLISFRNYKSKGLRKEEKNFWGWTSAYYDYKSFYSAEIGDIERINYMSGNDYKYTQISTNPISKDTFFKIQFEDELYLMSFKGDIQTSETDVHEEQSLWYSGYVTRYDVYDVDRLAAYLFSGISSMPYGSDCSILLEFGDMFNYYEPSEETEFGYKLVDKNKSSAVIEDIKSYYSIKITKHEGNIQKSSQSLFNCVNGNSNYNITNVESSDYFYGRTALSVDNSMFNFVRVIDNKIAFKLKEEFINVYKDYADKIYLDVLIDLDSLTSEGYEFVGFTADNGLVDFTVKTCQTVTVIDGELVYSGVDYVK